MLVCARGYTSTFCYSLSLQNRAGQGPELQLEIWKQVLSFQRRKGCVVKNKAKFQKDFSIA